MHGCWDTTDCLILTVKSFWRAFQGLNGQDGELEIENIAVLIHQVSLGIS